MSGRGVFILFCSLVLSGGRLHRSVAGHHDDDGLGPKVVVAPK